MKEAKDATVAKLGQINNEYHVTDKAMSATMSIASAASGAMASG
jgi:hypothetical protein